MKRHRSTTSEVWSQRLQRFPPILVRLLARDPRGRPLSTDEISDRSRMPFVKVALLSLATSWDHVPISDYVAFCAGCGLNLLDRSQVKRQETYLNGALVNGVRHPPQFLFLKRDPLWGSFYKPLMERYIHSLQSKLNPKGT